MRIGEVRKLMDNPSWFEGIKPYKTLFVIIVIGFFLIEIEIFAFAVMKSGRNSYMQVFDDADHMVYEVKGTTMTNFDKYYFENTFGPFEDYQVRIKTKETPFPFRAWFSAAVGLPIGLVLLMAFVLKAVTVFLHGSRYPSSGSREGEDSSKNGFEKLLFRVSSYNIFIIGFLAFAAVFLFWIIPDLLTFLARAGMETVMTFKWFFVGGFAAFFVLFAWFMYMKYQLAKKSMESELVIKKHQLSLEYAKAGLKQLPEFTGEDVSSLKSIEQMDPDRDGKGQELP